MSNLADAGGFMAALPEDSLRKNRDRRLFERDNFGHMPLHVSLLYFQLDTLGILLDHGSPVQTPTEGSPPLHIALASGAFSAHSQFAIDATKLLLQHGASASQVDDWHSTPLHVAARLGLLGALQLLLNTYNTSEADALELQLDPAHISAVRNSWTKENICALDTVLFSTDRGGETPMHAAAAADQPATLLFLLETIKNVHQRLLALCKHGEDMPEGFDGARLAAPAMYANKKGWTALHSAACAGSISCTQILCSSPAGKEASELKDRRGLTPKELAEDGGHTDVAAYLQVQSGWVGALEKQSVSLLAERTSEFQPSFSQLERSSRQTLIIHHDACLAHQTCDPAHLQRGFDFPPENSARLQVLLDETYGVLRADEFTKIAYQSGNKLPLYRWKDDPPRVLMSDLLRVHTWPYLHQLTKRIAKAAAMEQMRETGVDLSTPPCLLHLDADTVVSAGTWEAARFAAGAVIKATDEVVAGHARNAFAAVRPPGHHAGPEGVVSDLEGDGCPSANDANGSLGFCLINNIAVAASYALNVHRSSIKRVAILDFDVHHGNGTEAIVSRVVPSCTKHAFHTPYSSGVQSFPIWSPWLDAHDEDCIFFASVQGYGRQYGSESEVDLDAAHAAEQGPMFYPGTGKTCDRKPHSTASLESLQWMTAPASVKTGPRVINVGISGPGNMRGPWRRAWRDKILPELVSFDPDLIFISAGFDAHKKDEMNSGFVGLLEADYDWITREIVRVANLCCNGRVVSALEGGYKIGSRYVSAFARSVASHVRALGRSGFSKWSASDGKFERELEQKKREMGTKQLQNSQRFEGSDAPHNVTDVHPASSMVKLQGQKPENLVHSHQENNPSEEFSLGKRRRAAVDYQMLNRQLEEEQNHRARLHDTSP